MLNVLPLGQSSGCDMRTILRTFVASSLLTALLGLLTVGTVAAADLPQANSAKIHVANRVAAAQVQCDYGAVRCLVRVNHVLLARANPVPRTFRLREMWRYGPVSNQWIDITPMNIQPIAILAPAARRHITAEASQILFEVPQRVGLYFLRWMEDEQRYEGNAYVGRFLCNDILIEPPAPPGTYAACWPTEGGGNAGYIPKPPPPRK
jgi:hypothetical protein